MNTVAQVVEIVRDATIRRVAQYHVLRKAFSKVSDADIEAMTVRMAADPALATRKEPIDVAAYFLAIYCVAARRLKTETDALTHETIPLVFALMNQCADAINALVLLSRGGLVAEEQLREQAPYIAASAAGKKSREKYAEPSEWVRSEWATHEKDYKGKSDFARIYVNLVSKKFNVKVDSRTIAEIWLAPDRTVN